MVRGGIIRPSKLTRGEQILKEQSEREERERGKAGSPAYAAPLEPLTDYEKEQLAKRGGGRTVNRPPGGERSTNAGPRSVTSQPGGATDITPPAQEYIGKPRQGGGFIQGGEKGVIRSAMVDKYGKDVINALFSNSQFIGGTRTGKDDKLVDGALVGSGEAIVEITDEEEAALFESLNRGEIGQFARGGRKSPFGAKPSMKQKVNMKQGFRTGIYANMLAKARRGTATQRGRKTPQQSEEINRKQREKQHKEIFAKNYSEMKKTERRRRDIESAKMQTQINREAAIEEEKMQITEEMGRVRAGNIYTEEGLPSTGPTAEGGFVPEPVGAPRVASNKSTRAFEAEGVIVGGKTWEGSSAQQDSGIFVGNQKWSPGQSTQKVEHVLALNPQVQDLLIQDPRRSKGTVRSPSTTG